MTRYELYMQEYMEEAEAEMNRYWEEQGEVPAAKAYKENYYLRDHLQTPKITPILAKSGNRDKIIDFTAAFLDDHVEQLSTSGPVYIFTFGENEASFFYELFNTSPEEILKFYDEMVQETWDGKISKFFTGWVNHAPHKLLITAMLIDALQNDYDEIVQCCAYLWSFCEYALMYRYFWRNGVKKDVMDHTIEHLGTKYKIKKMNNLKELLYHEGMASINSHEERLKTGMDHTYTDFMYRMRNQIKNTFKNISRAYYDNNTSNASQHVQDSQFDDGSIAELDGHNTKMAQIIDRTITKLGNGSLNGHMLDVAAEANKINRELLQGYLSQIYATKKNQIDRFIENVITIYFTRNPTATTVGDNEFLNYGLALYRSLSGSKDPLMQELRTILNRWMYEIINITQFYQREGTIINYTRGVFNYFILMIQYYN